MIDPALSAVLKAYDIRGLAPDQLDDRLCRALGRGFAEELGMATGDQVVIGRDMRDTSPELAAAFAAGVAQTGADAVMLGLTSTDQLYAASGELRLPGAMVTASHNPAGYNGLKLCRASARPIGYHTGLAAIAERATGHLARPESAAPSGRISGRDFLAEYATMLHRLAPVSGRRLRIVVDAGNGMAGHTVPVVFAGLDVELVPLYFELDGTFPNHEANPLDPTTLVDLQAAVRGHRADLGLAFDGDADRCFAVDETGAVVSPSAITALIAAHQLADRPGATILYNVICSRTVPEVIAEHGGEPVRTPVGHSLVKAEMARTGAVFGGEHSGHFYFRDFFCADSGMLAALHVLAVLAADDRPASALIATYRRYVASGEINSVVGDQDAVLARLTGIYGAEGQDRLDGLTISARDWWFNVRVSNTEPLLRLNVEAVDEPMMRRVRDDVLAVIRDQ